MQGILTEFQLFLFEMLEFTKKLSLFHRFYPNQRPGTPEKPETAGTFGHFVLLSMGNTGWNLGPGQDIQRYAPQSEAICRDDSPEPQGRRRRKMRSKR